jgi:catechol 2,3-dioxygenase
MYTRDSNSKERFFMPTLPAPLFSQLAHVELITPVPAESLAFFTDVLGLELTEQAGQSAYLRGWGENFHHSLKLTEGPQPALGHIGWRAASPEALESAAARLGDLGRGDGWIDGDAGHGRAYRYHGPGGHVEEVFWDVERYRATGDMAPLFPHRPQRFRPRGAAVRQIDHVTVPTVDIMADAEFRRDVLGFRFTGWAAAPDNPDLCIFAQCTTNEQAHDLGLVPEMTAVHGRINHVAFWLDQKLDVLRAADVLLDHDIKLESGPGQHGMGEITYLYFREPGGVRIELNSGGYRNYEPDLETAKWTPAQGSNDWYGTMGFKESMFECFPPAESVNAIVEPHAYDGSR